MPRAIQLLSFLSPLRYCHEMGLAIFLKGVGLRVLWPQTLAMGGLGLAIFGLGLWRFARQLRQSWARVTQWDKHATLEAVPDTLTTVYSRGFLRWQAPCSESRR